MILSFSKTTRYMHKASWEARRPLRRRLSQHERLHTVGELWHCHELVL